MAVVFHGWMSWRGTWVKKAGGQKYWVASWGTRTDVRVSLKAIRPDVLDGYFGRAFYSSNLV